MTITPTLSPDTKRDTFALLDAARSSKGGETIHLRGSGHGRFIVGGLAPSIRVPHYQATHPATVNYVAEQIEAWLKDYPRAETLGSWQDIATGTIYIDLGTTHEQRDEAVHLAGLRGELAIYDAHDDTVERVR